MKTAIVSASALVSANRWDAGFHVINHEHGARAAELAATVGAEEAQARIARIPAHLLKFLAPLSRKNGRETTREAIDAITREYPHLSLALVESNMDSIRQSLSDEADALRRRIDDLGSLSDRIARVVSGQEPAGHDHTATGPLPGFAYPLLDPERFDDEFGTGYDHVALPEGEEAGSYSLRDMWPVNAEGAVHPGYANCPVPVQKGDFDLAKGRVANVIPSRPARGGWLA